uniref:Uncharacterized protein n=1 Tax=Anopheles culicifacies TaxID=139723 RepID=A0A182M7M2_9DIPT
MFTFIDPDQLPVKAQGLSMLLNYQCNPTEQQRTRLNQGLQLEHVCLQKEQHLVPGSCEAYPGSPVVYMDNPHSSPGMYMSGRHCGFGEPSIAIIFMVYETWIDSVAHTPAGSPICSLMGFRSTTYPLGKFTSTNAMFERLSANSGMKLAQTLRRSS